ncbi:energy transducer TonB [Flavobacterium sp.]|uniref:energy transducer TonB family protein n=1 Tax=Flavobacterium sp. TaxID=239 RepID=UPI002622B3C8|nr:energy transducer TonB [Flavobacterium sp.]
MKIFRKFEMLIVMVICNVSYSQTKMLYNGAFDRGKAKYFYYENNYERIFDGTFNYSDGYCSLSGALKNNLMTGTWTQTEGDAPSFTFGKKVIGSYINGKRNGKWACTIFENKLRKNYVLTFKNDTINSEVSLPKLQGLIKDGKFDGNWILNDGGSETIASFKNGVITKYVERYTSDGAVIIKYLPNIKSPLNVDFVNLSGNLYGFEIFEFDKKYYDSDLQLKISAFVAKVKFEINNFFSLACLNRFNKEINICEPILMVTVRENARYWKEKETRYTDENNTTAGLLGGKGNSSEENGQRSRNYTLAGRKALSIPNPNYTCNEEGTVVCEITVDNSGKVIGVVAGIRGSTNVAKCLLDQAKAAAQNARFDAKDDAPGKQVGKIVYNFKLN